MRGLQPGRLHGLGHMPRCGHVQHLHGSLLESRRSRQHSLQRCQRLHTDRYMRLRRLHGVESRYLHGLGSVPPRGNMQPLQRPLLGSRHPRQHSLQRCQRLHTDRYMRLRRLHGIEFRYLYGPGSMPRRRLQPRDRCLRESTPSRWNSLRRWQYMHGRRRLLGRNMRRGPGASGRGERQRSRDRGRPRGDDLVDPFPRAVPRLPRSSSPGPTIKRASTPTLPVPRRTPAFRLRGAATTTLFRAGTRATRSLSSGVAASARPRPTPLPAPELFITSGWSRRSAANRGVAGPWRAETPARRIPCRRVVVILNCRIFRTHPSQFETHYRCERITGGCPRIQANYFLILRVPVESVSR